MKYFIVIPARYHSSRLPGKPLAQICGLPMVVRVAKRAALVEGIEEVIVATDHEDIKKSVEEFGFSCVMTRPTHPSGTDRIYEAAERLGLCHDDVIINVQGDQPLLDIEAVSAMKTLYSTGNFPMTTVACPMGAEEARDPNRVKVVIGSCQNALYFSRSPIPYDRDSILKQGSKGYLRHLGLYCYDVAFLKMFVSWPEGRLEALEKLEQLRVLENGYSIGVAVVEKAPPEVDTEEDLERVRRTLCSGADPF